MLQQKRDPRLVDWFTVRRQVFWFVPMRQTIVVPASIRQKETLVLAPARPLS